MLMSKLCQSENYVKASIKPRQTLYLSIKYANEKLYQCQIQDKLVILPKSNLCQDANYGTKSCITLSQMMKSLWITATNCGRPQSGTKTFGCNT